MLRLSANEKIGASNICCLQLGGQAIQIALKLLPLITDATSNQALQQELLHAAICFISPACSHRFDLRRVQVDVQVDEASKVCLHHANVKGESFLYM